MSQVYRTHQVACIGAFCSPVVTDYTYDYTQRLAAVSGPSSAVNFEYNGLGDRLQQISGGVTTRYALDLNNDLAQVLSDGSNTYLYGPSTGSGGRIAQRILSGGSITWVMRWAA